MPFAASRSGKLHYEVVRNTAPWIEAPETIVFHHGIGGDPGIWTKWLSRLADKYQIVTFEMRGYGRSEPPADGTPWSLDLLASDVWAVADAAGVERFHLVGELIGGTVVLKCAIDEPRRLKSLTVSNGAHVGSTIQRASQWKNEMDTLGMKAWSDKFMADRFYDDALPGPEQAWFARCQEAWPRDTVLDALSVLVGTNLTPGLSRIQCPCLLLHGDASPFIPASVMAELHALLPRSSLQIFAHARHGLPFSHAAECAEVLRRFLDRLPPDAA